MVHSGPVGASIPTELVAAYDALLERAFRCAALGTYVYFENPEFARLSIDGDTATLRTVAARNDYDCCIAETENYTFDAALLSISDEEFAAVESEAREASRREAAEKRAMEARRAEAIERAQYEALRQKYGSQDA